MTWVAGGNGLHFGLSWDDTEVPASSRWRSCQRTPHGTWTGLSPESYCGLGLSLRARWPSAVLTEPIHFLMLALRSDIRNGRYRTLTTRLYVDDIFRRKAVVRNGYAKGGETSVYIDVRWPEQPQFSALQPGF